ncbi:14178_t:CDS:2 [Entrophospora sp. SA101]|nr:14178_t:CDS:2 [Entrophospora sp. SA101]
MFLDQSEPSKRQENPIIANIDYYHNIHGLHIPTTTSISAVAHMTIILAIPISQTSAIP